MLQQLDNIDNSTKSLLFRCSEKIKNLVGAVSRCKDLKPSDPCKQFEDAVRLHIHVQSRNRMQWVASAFTEFYSARLV